MLLFSVFLQLDPITMAFYDAVILYANGIKRLVESNKSIMNVHNLLSSMKNISVKTPLDTFINMTLKGDRNILCDVKLFDQEQGYHMVKIEHSVQISSRS